MNYKVGDKLSDEDMEYILENRHLNHFIERYVPDKNFLEFGYNNKYFIVYNKEIIYELEEFIDYNQMSKYRIDGRHEPVSINYINGKQVEAGEYLRMASVDYVIKKHYEEKA